MVKTFRLHKLSLRNGVMFMEMDVKTIPTNMCSMMIAFSSSVRQMQQRN